MKEDIKKVEKLLVREELNKKNWQSSNLNLAGVDAKALQANYQVNQNLIII